MQQNLILVKTFGNVKKVQNNEDGQTTDRLKKLTVLSIFVE